MWRASPEFYGKPREYCHPHHRIPSDIEHAPVIPPWEECCPGGDDNCECVTSGDVARWNYAYEELSAFSGVDLQKIAEDVQKYDEFAASADKWNWTYGEVSGNEDEWNKIRELSGVPAHLELHDEQIAELSANQATLSADLDKKADAIKYDIYDREINPEGSFILDDGELKVRNYPKLAISKQALEDIQKHLKPIPNTPALYELYQSPEFSAWSGYSAFGPYPTRLEDVYITDGVAWWILANDRRLSAMDVKNVTQDGLLNQHWSAIDELWRRYRGMSGEFRNIRWYTGDDKTISATKVQNRSGATPEIYKLEVIDLPEEWKKKVASGVDARKRTDVLSAEIDKINAKSFFEFKPREGRDISACTGDNIIWYDGE